MASKSDLSLEESGEEIMDDDTADSLDIKPPQAQRAEKRHKPKKSLKEKKHSGKHKHHRSHERFEKQTTEKYREDARRPEPRYVEYFQHPARPGRDQQPRYEQNYYRNERGDYNKKYQHQERRHERDDRMVERRRSPQQQQQQQQQHHSSEADRITDEILQDLRSKLLMKKKHLDEVERESTKNERRVEKIDLDPEPPRRRDESESRKDKEKRHKEKSRRIDVDEDVIEEIKPIKKSKVKEAEDVDLVARRARLLEADREMARRKELARDELEARRELRRERGGKTTDESPSPEPKKKRNKNQSPIYKTKSEKNYEDPDIVMVSDHTEPDDEIDTESDSESESEHSEEHSKTESDPEIQHSPLSVGDISKSERRRRNSLHSRSRSRSEDKRSRSRSHHSDESLSLSSEEHESRSSRSRSRHRSYSRDRSRTRSRSTEHSEDENNKVHRNQSPPSPKDNKNDHDSDNDDDNKNEIIKNDVDELPAYFPAIQGCRSVEEFQCLNRIEEGTYGVVYRAKDKRTNEIVALKRLKMEKEKEGFPITSLREINTLLKGQHPNIVTVREIVVGSNMDKIFIVMDYVEHDLKSLMETMKHKKQFFLPGEVKCLLQQLLRAVAHLHDNWILHRDLKTSNLLLSHKGILKVGDFGLAREYGSPLKQYTPIVVTLWYRAPELLLCCKEYSTPIDIWSVGCIFAEFLSMQPLFPGKSEVDQLNRIFKDLGTPNEKIWPGYSELPAVQKMTFTDYPVSNLRKKFSKFASELGLSLLQGLLTYDPKQRLTAETGLKSSYFKELPLPIDPAMFPTWPAKSELGLKKALASSPKPPSGGGEFKRLGEDPNEPGGFHIGNITFAESRQLQMGPGFSLKF